MTVTNDFLVYAQGGGANVESQASYAADPLLPLGNQPGIAVSAFNNKALRQANAITSQLAQLIANVSNTNVTDDATPLKLLAQMTSVLTPISVLPFAQNGAGTGTFYLDYFFFCASANATSGATYTHNAFTYTVVTTISGGVLLRATGTGIPLFGGTLTKATGTGDATIAFYCFRMPTSLDVLLVGPGGGGAGGGTGPGSGGTGSNSTFGTSLLVASAGGGGAAAAANGGTGGGANLGTGPVGLALVGGMGSVGYQNGASLTTGGAGGSSSQGGGGSGGFAANNGAGGQAPGSGGGGGGANSGGSPSFGGGGGAGGSVNCRIPSTISGFSTGLAWVVGGGPSGGSAGSAGGAGGSGHDGLLLVQPRY